MLASRVSRTRAVLLVGLLLCGWAGALHARAALAPPPGRAFVGTFHWIDDVYNYVSYAQQAEDGRFLMRNKLVDPARERPLLVNLEWWSVGRLSAALGRRPLLAYRLFAVLATLALVAAAERWLSRAGVPPSHRFVALWLVFVGGGLGGLLFEATDVPARHCLDLSVAAFPYLEVLANPHFAAGTALLAWALWCFACVPSPRGPWLGVALGTVLGLVRPYDLALLGVVRGASVVVTRPPSRWARELVPLAGLLPVLAYDAWLFFGTDQFASFRQGSDTPPWWDFLPAFGPAALARAGVAAGRHLGRAGRARGPRTPLGVAGRRVRARGRPAGRVRSAAARRRGPADARARRRRPAAAARRRRRLSRRSSSRRLSSPRRGSSSARTRTGSCRASGWPRPRRSGPAAAGAAACCPRPTSASTRSA